MQPLPHSLHIFLTKHLCYDDSQRGETSETLQSASCIMRWFLAMDGSRQEQFATPKIGVWKSESLFYLATEPPLVTVPLWILAHPISILDPPIWISSHIILIPTVQIYYFPLRSCWCCQYEKRLPIGLVVSTSLIQVLPFFILPCRICKTETCTPSI